jgi:hypothetical protein
LLKDVLTNCFRDTRYEQHFVRLMLQIEGDKGAALVLATPKNRMAGLAAVARRDTFEQQHLATLSLRVVPGYIEHAGVLLQAVLERAQRIGVSLVEFPIAAVDDDLAAIASEAGFDEVARLPNRIGHGDAWVDVRIFTASLVARSQPFHASNTYYGNRHSWHSARVSGGPDADWPKT